MTRTINIPRAIDDILTVELTPEQNALFVLGPNGSGKSALLHYLTKSHQAETPDGSQMVRWVTAHRQTILSSNRPEMTSWSYRDQRSKIAQLEGRDNARYKDDYADQRVLHVLYQLLNAERRRQERIGDLLEESLLDRKSQDMAEQDSGEAGQDRVEDIDGETPPGHVRSTPAAKFSAENPRPISTLNDLFRSSSLDIRIEAVDNREALMARNVRTGAQYEIQQLSDGERSALLLAAEVLTVPPGTLLVLDEPERHLHRSIASPLLAGLFAERRDCEFVVSTHEVMLPQDCGETAIVLLRGCSFSGQRASAWDADLLDASASIPEEVKLDVWGARRTLVFVEGEPHSLDRRIYEAVFPGVTFVPKGGWSQVVRAVQGISTSSDLHWLKALGLIDRDSPEDDELTTAARQRVHRLDCHAVESLYYDPMIRREVGKVRCEETGDDFDAVMAGLNDAILVDAGALHGQTTVDSARLQRDIENRDVDAVIANYPIKKSGIPATVARQLQFPSRGHYERAAIVKLRGSVELRQHIASKCGGLQDQLPTAAREDEQIESQPQAAA